MKPHPKPDFERYRTWDTPSGTAAALGLIAAFAIGAAVMHVCQSPETQTQILGVLDHLIAGIRNLLDFSFLPENSPVEIVPVRSLPTENVHGFARSCGDLQIGW